MLAHFFIVSTNLPELDPSEADLVQPCAFHRWSSLDFHLTNDLESFLHPVFKSI